MKNDYLKRSSRTIRKISAHWPVKRSALGGIIPGKKDLEDLAEKERVKK